MQKIEKKKEMVVKPDYYDIEKVPIEEWEERVLYEKLSHHTTHVNEDMIG